MRTYDGEDAADALDNEEDIRAFRRTSHRRIMRCERNLRRISRSYKATLSIDEGHQTAHIDMESDPSHAVISGRQFEQPETDYSPLAWDWLCQRVLTAHEAAHGRYTNHDDFMQRLDAYDKRQKGIVKNLWNAAEDCAIEAHLRRAIPAYDDLITTFRANLMASNNPNTVSLASATSMAILEKGTYESGRVKKLLNPSNEEIQFASDDDRDTFVNEIAPHIDGLLKDILKEPNAEKRNERIFAFVDAVLEHIENADDPDSDVDEKADGESRDGSQNQPPQDTQQDEEAEQSEDSDENEDGAGSGDEEAEESEEQDDESGGGNGSKTPDDEDSGQGAGEEDEDGEGEEQQDSESGGEEETDDQSDEQDGGDGAGDEDEDDTPQQGAGGMPNDADTMNGSGDTDEADKLDGADTDANGHVKAPASADDVQTDASIQQDLEDDVNSEGDLPTPDSGGNSSSSGGLEDDNIEKDREEPARFDAGTWDSAMDEANRLERVLDDLTTAKSRRQRHQRRGRLDGSSLHRTKTGEKRIKMRQEKPDDPEMGFVLVVDRSGSMSGSLITAAERAAAAFAEALERVGIDVMVLSLRSGRVHEDLRFDEEPEQRRADLTNNRTGGGTPLTEALRVASNRIQAENLKERRVLVISDDQPNSPAQYRQQVRACSFPVVGVLLSDSADKEDYTRAVESAPDGSTLSTDLQRLAHELVHAT